MASTSTEEMMLQVKKYVLSGLAKQVNEEVMKRLPQAEQDYLSHNNDGNQRVRNRYYAYNRVADDFSKIDIEFYIQLGKLSGRYVKEIQDYTSNRLVNENYDPEEAYRKRLRRPRKKKNKNG